MITLESRIDKTVFTIKQHLICDHITEIGMCLKYDALVDDVIMDLFGIIFRKFFYSTKLYDYMLQFDE